MKLKALFLIAAFLGTAPVHAANNFSSKNISREPGPLVAASQSIPLGEKLFYDIAWLGVPVATASVWVKEKVTLNGRAAYHVLGVIDTNGVLATLYPVHDEIESWIDVETLESLQFERNVREKTKRAHDRTTFDPENGKGHFESFLTKEKETVDVQKPVHDVLSVFYWGRRQALEPGKPVKAPVNVNRKNWEMELVPLRREILEPRGRGVVDTLVIEPRSRVDKIEKKGKCWIHIVNDPARKPIRVSFKAPFGTVVGTLRPDAP